MWVKESKQPPKLYRTPQIIIDFIMWVKLAAMFTTTQIITIFFKVLCDYHFPPGWCMAFYLHYFCVPSVHNVGLVSRLRFPIKAYHGVHHHRSSCVASISPTVVKSSSSLLMYNLGIWTFIGKNGNIETRNPHDLSSKNSKTI